MFDILKKLGLSECEIDIYINLLKKGPSKVINISKDLNVARTTIYRFLDSLQDKGLISEFLDKNIKKFKSINPNNLLQIYKQIVE